MILWSDLDVHMHHLPMLNMIWMELIIQYTFMTLIVVHVWYENWDINIDVLITRIIMMFWTRDVITETLIKLEMLQYDEMRSSALWVYIGSLSLNVFKVWLIRNVQCWFESSLGSKLVWLQISVFLCLVVWWDEAFRLGWMCSHCLHSYFTLVKCVTK